MSLEAQIARLAEAVELNNKLLAQAGEERQAILKGGVKPASSEAKPSSEGEAEKPRRGRPPGSGKASTDADDKAIAPSVEDVAKLCARFLEVDDDDEREKRKGKFRKLLEKHEAPKARELPENKRAPFMKELKKLIDEAEAASEDEDY